MQTLNLTKKVFDTDDWTGLLVAIIILGLWFASLVGLLTYSEINCFVAIVCILARTYIHTGLFILAHDAMHGNLIPQHKFLNNLIGRCAVGVYGFLPYDHCQKNHHRHHRYPSQNGDPDFHGDTAHPFFWYCKFMREYFPLRSLIIFLVNVGLLFLGLTIIFHVQFLNLVLFWLLPLVFSSLQLFFFGTYLPHRQVQQNQYFLPRTESDRYSIIWSFFSCYNFGHYHWEHHEYPQVPWYRLHQAQQKR
jgi:beta-carotene ketolase (CrtW type)